MSNQLRMIRDYIQYSGVYVDEGTIDNIEIKGDVIQFESHSTCSNYHEKHQIDIIDIMAWLHSTILSLG